MAFNFEERARAEGMNVPTAAVLRRALDDFIGKTDFTRDELAERIGYAETTLKLWTSGRYGEVAADDTLIRKAVWEFLERNPVTPRAHARGRLFETENYRQIRRYFLRAAEHGEVALLYGPPGVQKTFSLEHLICERNRQKKSDAVYVYASAKMRAAALLKRIGREVGAKINVQNRERVMNSILHRFSLAESVPALVIDEAQHLSVECLEILRELHDRSGCGLVLAGSHSLFESFVRPDRRPHLEQWLSRIDHKEQLPGLRDKEVCEIAARELGNGQPAKLSAKQKAAILSVCRVDDVYARRADGKPARRQYYSARRLVKNLEKLREESRQA